MRLRIGTRGSALALVQARAIRRKLDAAGHDTQIEVIKTSGDKDQVRPFAQVGEPGLFVREIESALLGERIDLAVHCYKDLPSVSPDGLTIAAVPEREDQRDLLLIRAEANAPDAPGLPVREGARIGTASARRIALVKHLREDATTLLLRGNVPTRLRRLAAGDFDAILLASAGLRRLAAAAARGEIDALDLSGIVECPLDPTTFVPAPSQGALALQVRADDEGALAAVGELDSPGDRRAVSAERALLTLVEAGCQAPFGAWCRSTDDDRLELFGALEEGGELRRGRAIGDDTALLAREVHAALLPEGKRSG